MKTSILISNYNKEKYIEECILSALNQGYKDLEIIVFDNESSDNSLNIINQFSEKIKISTKKRISSFASYNQIDLIIESFKISTGSIICLLDGDDFFLPNKISTIVNHFSKNPKTNIIFDIPRVNINDNIAPLMLKNFIFNNSWPPTIPTSGISFRRKFFESCLKFDILKNYPILEIDFRFNFLSKKIYNNYIDLDDHLTVYRKVDDGIMSNIKKFKRMWWIKRLEAHRFIKHLYVTNGIKYYNNFDYYLTKIIVFFLNRKVN
jgi:glycosyltransferase involved in cell wall biosynthesis